MKRTARIVLVAVVAVLALLLVLPFLVPVNSFRPLIESQASAALGRNVQIGDLSLSILRGSISAEDLSIADDPKFSSSPFLTAKSLGVGVELVPLIFSRALKITGITVDEPQVTLLRAATGGWNYSSLGRPSSKADPDPVRGQPGGLSLVPGDVFIKSLKLKNGRIIVGSVSSSKRSTYENVDAVANDFSMNSRFPLTVSASLPGGGKLEFNGFAGPLDKTDAAHTPVDARLHVSSLNLATTGFLDPSLGLGGLVGMDCAIASRNGQTATQGTLRISSALLVAGGAPATVPVVVDFSTKYDQVRNSGVINSSTVKIGNATARLNGTYVSHGDNTVVDLSLTGNGQPARDVEAFLPAIGVHLPKGASLTTGTLDANLSIKGPTHRLVTDGILALSNARLTGFNLGSKMSAISALAGVDTGSDLTIEKLTTNLRIAPDGLRVDNLNALVPSLGSLIGTGTVDARNRLDFKMVARLHSIPTSGTGGTAIAGALGGLLGQVTGGGKGGMNVPFRIEGTTSDPRFVPDVGGLALEVLKSQAASAGAAPAGTQQQNSLGALGDLFKKKKKP